MAHDRLKDEADWSPEFEIAAYQNSKRESLDTFEELQETANELKSKDPGYFSKLATKVLDNLQVSFLCTP